MTYKTSQEQFWSGEFGEAYRNRNAGEKLIANNTAFFSRVLARAQGIESIIEFGSNTGLNLKALATILPRAHFSAVEINAEAAEALRQWQGISKVYHQSILDFQQEQQTWDLTFVKGVLIHINPDELPNVYRKLYDHSNRYILLAEYYNPTPVSIDYRGHSDRLFKRDFAGEIMDAYPSLELIDYGFCWRRDPAFPQDDLTWFLLKK